MFILVKVRLIMWQNRQAWIESPKDQSLLLRARKTILRREERGVRVLSAQEIGLFESTDSSVRFYYCFKNYSKNHLFCLSLKTGQNFKFKVLKAENGYLDLSCLGLRQTFIYFSERF